MKPTDHILDQTLERYARREANAAEILRIQTHLSACDACRQKMAFVADAPESFEAVRETFAFDDAGDELEHLTYEQLEFFLDHKLDEVDREIVESHLAFCGACETDLKDLLKYREIAQSAPVVTLETSADTSTSSFWRKLFFGNSIGVFAPVAALLVVAVLVGAWLLLRGNRANEIAQNDGNQNSVAANFNTAQNVSANNVSPESSPQILPAPSEDVSGKETLYALNDGNLKIDDKGNLQGAENLAPSTRDLVKRALQNGKVTITNNALGGTNGVLMGENNSGGVPFALASPIGKVIRDAQPVLNWKPLKDAESYSVAVVDEKFRVVAESGKISSTSWKLSKPLPRGVNYSWQVTAVLPDGTETVSPSSPAPQARFRVLEQNLTDEINRLEKSADRSHLALGVLYAKAGLKQEARAEFEKLVKENPQSAQARRLLQSAR